MRTSKHIALFLACCLISGHSWANSRSGAVFADGRVHFGPAGMGQQAKNHHDCEDNPDLVFRFTETVSSEQLRVEVGRTEQQQVTLTVRIDLACESGGATFEYRHERDADLTDENAEISPLAPVVRIDLAAGTQVSSVISYRLLNARLRSAQATLIGERISFIAGQRFGQTGQRRPLAQVRFLGDVVDEELFAGPGNRRPRETGGFFNEACRDAPSGSRFAEVCEEIRENATTEQLQRQAVNAFDAHGLTVIPKAAGEGGRIQNINISERISDIRGGQAGPSISGLSLSFNGQTLDQGWLPAGLSLADDTSSSRLMDQPWGLFVNGNIVIGRRSERGKELAFDFDSWGVTTGVDYRFGNGAVAGLAVGYSHYDADIDNTGGDLDGRTLSAQLFGSLDLRESLYVDLTAGYSRGRFEQQRVVDLSGIGSLTREMAMGSTRSSQFDASLAANYRLALDNGLTFTPYGQFYWADVRIDGFSEQGSVFDFRYPDQDYTSTIWSSGLRATRAFSMERGILSPFIDWSWQYQSGIDSYVVQPMIMEIGLPGPEIEVSDPDRSFSRLDAGMSWVLRSGNQFYVSYSALLAERDTRMHTLYFGARWEF